MTIPPKKGENYEKIVEDCVKRKKSLLAGILVNLLSQIVVEILEKTDTIYSVVFGVSLLSLIIILALISE